MASRFAQALRALEGAGRARVNPSLASIEAMTAALGRPQDAYRCIQVTGTNGKSSTARMIARILGAHGLAVGLYTSPELLCYTERIEIEAAPVAHDEFAAGVEAAFSAAKLAGVDPTEFELLTAAALWLFRERKVDVAVLEVGMGGRWDATSVATPEVAVVTGVGLDHMEFLGPTLEAIAAEKAQIIRPASTTVLGPGTAELEAIFRHRAEEVASQVIAVRASGALSPSAEAATTRFEVTSRPTGPDGRMTLDVRTPGATFDGIELAAPAYQAPNAATAITAAEAFLGERLESAKTREALAATRVPGRFQVVAPGPFVVVDGAHNPQAAEVLASAIRDAWPRPDQAPVVVLGVLGDKDASSMLAALAPVASRFVCVTPDSSRALGGAALAQVVSAVTGVKCGVYNRVSEALDILHISAERDIVVTGSLRTVAEGVRWGCNRV